MSDTINDFFDSLEKENLSGKEIREKNRWVYKAK